MPREARLRSCGNASPRGFSILVALFIIVVLAALAVFLVGLTAVSTATPTLTLFEARALDAARSGFAWGAEEALSQNACPPATTLRFTTPGLAGFQATVDCTETTHVENGTTIDVFAFVATASDGTYGKTLTYVSRTLHGTVSDVPPP
jgi:MSHA biogenesis protein MshP